MNANYIGIIIILLAYAINRFVMTAATKKLDDALKLKIFEAFSKRNNITTVITIVLVAIYFAALQFIPDRILLISVIYFAAILVYLLVRFVSNYRKLKELNVPRGYIKSFIFSYGIFIVGFLGMAVFMFGDWMNYE